MNSGTVLAGTEGWTNITKDMREIAARGDIPIWVYGELPIEGHIGCVRRPNQQKCIAVRGRVGGCLRTYIGV